MKKLQLFLVYLLYLSVFGLASLAKLTLLPGPAPDWFQKQFAGTFLNLFPGALSLNFYFIGLLEALVALGMIASICRREYLSLGPPQTLIYSLLLAEFVFVILGFGLRLTQDFQGAANLVVYFGVTWLILESTRNYSPTG